MSSDWCKIHERKWKRAMIDDWHVLCCGDCLQGAAHHGDILRRIEHRVITAEDYYAAMVAGGHRLAREAGERGGRDVQ